ncbi:MAG: arsenite efflux transporter metallochaperone ArsD [Bacteroidales bacterium]
MKLEIFEPSLCCPSGVCGPEPDKELIELQNVIQLLAKVNIKPERYAINQSPIAFVNNPVVKDFMRTEGPAKLPVTLLDGKIIKQESYPSLEELTMHIPQLKEVKPDGKILGIFS